MKREVAGVPLADLEEPIRYALRVYSHLADGQVGFDTELAGKLELTPDKPNTARSTTAVTHLGETIATMSVIAFAPEDGTGDDKTYTADQVRAGVYPPNPKYFPRSKAAADSEVHLALVAQRVESRGDPVLFAGHLRVLGLVGNNLISEIGYVGQNSQTYDSALRRNLPMVLPTATLTTGYRGALSDPSSPGERFGDPHSIINRSQTSIQVCGFLAISHEMVGQHRDALRLLRAVEPQF